MKRLLLFLPLLLLFFTQTAQAHLGPPYVKINGVLTLGNPATSGSVLFKIANALSAEPVVVNQNATFTIQVDQAPFKIGEGQGCETCVPAGNLFWEFGDGGTAQGVSGTHKYSKTGSYIAKLRAHDPTTSDPIDLETIQINIIPTKDYTTPKAVVKVNGTTVTDPFNQPLSVDKNSTTYFDAGSSTGNIKSYSWDFADGSKLETGKKVSHKFDFSQPYAYSYFPILRVEDKNGIYSDAVVQVSSDQNAPKTPAKSSTNSSESKASGFNPAILGILTGLALLGAGVAAFLIFKKRK
ncbi:MAG TPA: PKD domain-containing protein [Candidatus Saccharimonadales bacterium]|nr:PKD domain-containing protein [Candidatus Saccharimonadales bacterium]